MRPEGDSEPNRRRGPGWIADPRATSPPPTSSPAPEAPTFTPVAIPRLDPIFPGDPVQRQLVSLSCWPCPSWLLHWRALKFKHGTPPPRGAQACGEPRATPGPGWGGRCGAPINWDFPALVPWTGGKTEKHLAVVNTSYLPSCPCKQTELWWGWQAIENPQPATGVSYLLAPGQCLWAERKEWWGLLALSFSCPATPKDPEPALDLVLIEIPETSSTSQSILRYLLRLNLLLFY